MMKSLALLTSAILAISFSAGARGQETEVIRLQREAETFLVGCDTTKLIPGESCADAQKLFVANYVLAMRGEYTGQYNMASTFRSGDGIVREDRHRSCAWRIVILLSGHTEQSQRDVDYAKMICEKLPGASYQAAKETAQRMRESIAILPKEELRSLRKRLLNW